MSKKQLVIALTLLILALGIPVTLFLVQRQQTIKSQAGFINSAEFVDRAGNVITETDSTNVRLRIKREQTTEVPTNTTESNTSQSGGDDKDNDNE